MKINQAFRHHVSVIFAPLENVPATSGLPAIGKLSESLSEARSKKANDADDVVIRPSVAAMFASAAIEMWMRAIQSFIISASVSDVSPIWSSVAGYYSSHYSIRAFGHLLGYFNLHNEKATAQLRAPNGAYVCSFKGKRGGGSEHAYYWRVVKRDVCFASDPLFTINDRNAPCSDVGHRNKANYYDHVYQCFPFRTLDERKVRERIVRLEGIEFDAPPIPDVERWPDVTNVQIVAYLRLVRFRECVDNILGNGNNYWRVHRDPEWARKMMDYQVVPQASMRLLGGN